MKRLWFAALVLCWGTATAQGLGLILTAFKMLSSDNVEVYYAKVQASGQHFEEAKTRAFRLAVEQAVGSVVLSETEMRNQHITRDEIVTYSSGLVDRYNVLSRQDTDNRTEIIVEVWVAHSAIANRLLAKNATEQGINGERLATQLGFLQEERQRGDRLLQTVLNDHPRRSMTVKSRPPRIVMDAGRNIVVDLDWEVHWAAEFENSLRETVRQFHVKCSFWGSSCPQRFGLLGYDVADLQKSAMVYRRLAHTPVAIQFSVLDQHERVILNTCQPIDLENVMITMYNDVVSMPNRYVKGTQKFYFGNNTQYISTLTRFNAQVVERTQCQR